jgi:hypothetical protein
LGRPEAPAQQPPSQPAAPSSLFLFFSFSFNTDRWDPPCQVRLQPRAVSTENPVPVSSPLPLFNPHNILPDLVPRRAYKMRPVVLSLHAPFPLKAPPGRAESSSPPCRYHEVRRAILGTTEDLRLSYSSTETASLCYMSL